MGKRLAVEGKTRLFGFGGTEVYRLIQLSFPELYHFIAPILNQHLDYFCSENSSCISRYPTQAQENAEIALSNSF